MEELQNSRKKVFGTQSFKNVFILGFTVQNNGFPGLQRN